MGYIDKNKMLHDMSAQQNRHLMLDDDLQYAFWEVAMRYVMKFPEETATHTDSDTVDIMWIEKGEKCLVRIDGVFYEAKRAKVKECDSAKTFKIALNLANPAESPAQEEEEN